MANSVLLETELAMDKRPLGPTGLEIAPLIFGGNVFSWTVDEQTTFALLNRFVEAGLNAIDTADAYPIWAIRAANLKRLLATGSGLTLAASDDLLNTASG